MFCNDCGLELAMDCVPEYGFHHVPVKKPRGIIEDLKKLGFSGKIAVKANDLYNIISRGKIYRGNSRKSIVFASLVNSFKLDNNPQSFDDLVAVFNINRKSALKGLKESAHHVPPECLEINENVLIKQTLQKFESYNQPYYTEITALHQIIKDRSSIINRSRPTSVVCGLIYYFIVAQHKNITITQFAEKVALSTLTLIKICKEIDTILHTNYFANIRRRAGGLSSRNDGP